MKCEGIRDQKCDKPALQKCKQCGLALCAACIEKHKLDWDINAEEFEEVS